MQNSLTITKKSASNLAMAFVLLPKAKREAMTALYAFCREVDDVADEESVPCQVRREQLSAWREDIRLACEGKKPEFAVNQELQPFIAQYSLSYTLFDELIRGVEMDLDIQRYSTYQELEGYCYRVASVVGLLSIEIFGYKDPACRDYAIYLGKALQLTNILRDVRTDAERGRIYIPQSELKHFEVTEEEILSFSYSDRFERMADSIATEAKRYYELARRTLPAVDRRSMSTAELMGSVYWKLLTKLEKERYNVLTPQSTRLSKGEKVLSILGTWFRQVSGSQSPSYGCGKA